MIDAHPQIAPISFSTESLMQCWRYGPRLLGWIGEECKDAPRISLAFLFMPSDAFLSRGCHLIADRVGVYTVNDAQRARQLLLRSADLVETNYYSFLQEQINVG